MDKDAAAELLGTAMRDAAVELLCAAVRDKKAALELLGAAMMVYSIPRVATQALAVFPGKGEVWRVQDAIRSWEQDLTIEYLLVANNNLAEETAVLLDMDELKKSPYNLKREKGLIIFGPKVRNTKDQAKFVSTVARQYKISSITLFVSPYHLLRAYLTLLKKLQVDGIDLILIPAPTPVAPTTFIPEGNTENAWQLVPGEARRIIEYQGRGDVATVPELTRYLTWLWDQEKLLSIRLGKVTNLKGSTSKED